MRKTLLIAAAALAASIISSQAQVYSQNIVGYVNITITNGYNTISIPLDASGGNALTNTINNAPVSGPGTGPLDGAALYLYNLATHKFDTYIFDTTQPTGFGDATDLNPASPPNVNPGTAFFINNNTGNAVTNTFVGSVHIASVPGTVTNTLPANSSFAASVLPEGGLLQTVLNLTNSGPAYVLDGIVVNIPKISGSPQAVHGYLQVVFDHTMATGFGDATDFFPAPEPSFSVGNGAGFLLNNNAGLGPVSWVQSL